MNKEYYNYTVSSDGSVYSKTGKKLRPVKKPSGYLNITIRENGQSRTWRVHRLIATVFIPNPKLLPQVNHINGVKTDNRVENLEWCTASENIKHAFRTGLSTPLSGDCNSASILTTDQVIKIKQLLSEGVLSQYRIAKNFGVHKVTIFDIKHGNTWRHI